MKFKWLGGVVLIGGAIALGVALARRAGTAQSVDIPLPNRRPSERRSDPDREALEALASGDVERVGVNLERLREIGTGSFEPLIEYLTYIQVKRGDTESLVFVRRRDLDAMAAMAATDKEQFVEEFQKLGVLLSMN